MTISAEICRNLSKMAETYQFRLRIQTLIVHIEMGKVPSCNIQSSLQDVSYVTTRFSDDKHRRDEDVEMDVIKQERTMLEMRNLEEIKSCTGGG